MATTRTKIIEDTDEDQKIVGVRFLPEQRRWLASEAARQERTLSWIVRRIVRDAMEAAQRDTPQVRRRA